MMTTSSRLVPVLAADGAASAVEIFDAPSLSLRSPVMLLMPAMGVEARWYDRLADAMAERGMRLVTAQPRGRGRSSVRAGPQVDFGYAELVELDWPAAVDAVVREYPAAPRVLFGHSLGGQLSCLFCAANPGRVHGLVTLASCSVYWAAFPWRYRSVVLIGSQICRAAASVVGFHAGDQLRFGGRDGARLITDWAHQALTGRYDVRNGAIDYDQALTRLDTPTLAMSLQGDDFFAPRSAVDHLVAKLPSGCVRREHLDHPALTGLSSLHFFWVARPEPVLDRVVAWLDEALGIRSVG